MTLFNVITHVVELVEADTLDDAISGLHVALDRAGFTIHVDPGVYEASGFESEPAEGASHLVVIVVGRRVAVRREPVNTGSAEGNAT